MKKDNWDRFAVLSSFLVPIAVAFGGWWVSAAVSKNQEILDKNRHFVELQRVQLEQSGARISQAASVATFFEHLLVKDDPARRELAIEAVKISLPEHWPALIKAAGKSNPHLRTLGNKLLDEGLNGFIADLFASSSSQRRAAYNSLIGGYRDDLDMVKGLLKFALAQQKIILTTEDQELKGVLENGIFNTLVVFSHMDQSLRDLKHDELLDFSKIVEINGELTKERAEKLRSRLRSQNN